MDEEHRDGWLDDLTHVVDTVMARPVFGFDATHTVTALDQLATITTQLETVRAGLVHHLGGLDFAHAQGASSLPVWLRDHSRISIGAAHRLVGLGCLLDQRPAIQDAMSTGVLNPEQATVIGHALAALPDDVGPTIYDQAETVLIHQAADFDPSVLRKLGERVLAHVAPDVAQEALRRALERDEATARQSRTLTLSPDGSGRSPISGWLDTHAAATLHAAIAPYCAPRPGDDSPDLRSAGQRRADALIEVCEQALASGDLPDVGAQRPQISITIDFDALRRQIGAGRLDTGELLSASLVRRLACDARILPTVLGGDGAVLDVGRSRRLFTGVLRHALVLRDRGCAFPGCDRPPHWTQAHHIISWIDGGPTDLHNGILLCAHHHRVIHTGAWQVIAVPGARPVLIPPPHVDPDQRPRRNHHHHTDSGCTSSPAATGPGRTPNVTPHRRQ